MSNVSGKPKELKRINTSLILNSIKSRSIATRADIVEDTKISHTTVRVILRELIDNEEIISIGLGDSSGGRRAEQYIINSNKKCVLVLLLEKSKVYYEVINILGERIDSGSITIKGLDDKETVLNLIDNVCELHENIKSIGLSVPGIVTDRGYISGLKEENWKEINIKECIEEKVELPVILENDLNLAALGFYNEYQENYNKNNISLAYLNFTTLGAGAGIIANGQLVKGDNNCAGEIGILPMKDSTLNELLLKEIDDSDYIDIILDTIKIVTCIFNPETVVLGGNNFKENLGKEIVKKYNEVSNIKSNILIETKDKNHILEGIKGITLNTINSQVILINT